MDQLPGLAEAAVAAVLAQGRPREQAAAEATVRVCAGSRWVVPDGNTA